MADNELHEREDSSNLRQMSSSSTKFLYSVPLELLKSNRMTTFSLPQYSQNHLQAEIEALEVLELTVKQHHQELLGEKALLTMGKEF